MTAPATPASVFDEVSKARAAHRLAQEGLWVRRDFCVDEHGNEVPDGHHDAVSRDYLMEVDYDRIVHVVVEALTLPTASATTPGETTTPTPVPVGESA